MRWSWWCWSHGEHVGRHFDGGYGVGQVFGRKNVIRVLSREGIMCVKYMV